MTRLPLTLACWDYDRVRPLMDGTVRPDGIALNILPLSPEEVFHRMIRHREFDAAEMSLSSYTLSLRSGPGPFVGLPVFLSRTFRHADIYVHARSGIERPEDVVGKRVGVPEYQMTATVWIRGLLSDAHGVDPASVDYLTGGQEEPGRDEKIPLDLPPRFRIRRIGPHQTLSRMLVDGDLDVLTAARPPTTLTTRPDDVRRLFPDPTAASEAWFARTRILPIMHLLVLRRDVYEANRWIAATLTEAFTRAKAIAQAALEETAALKVTLPFLPAHVARTRELMGNDPWPYGLAPNRHVLDAFLRHHHEQGLSPRRLAPEELFAPETLDHAKI